MPSYTIHLAVAKPSSNPNLEAFKQKCGLENSYLRGYYLHLKTDFLFYNECLQYLSKDIYNDYDTLNNTTLQILKMIPLLLN